jgi:hypothetical protein
MTSARDLPNAAAQKKILAAMEKRDWDRVAELVADFPLIRQALARRESYALVEQQEPIRSFKQSVGWMKVNQTVRNVRDTVRFVKERDVHGYYRIISVKRRVRYTANGARPIVDLAVPRSKPMYELEQWLGHPTKRKRSAWTRLPFPTDWRERRGAIWNEWIAKHGPMEDCEEAMDYLDKLGCEGSYRVFTVNRHISIGIVDGKQRKWSGHCMFPDDGRNREYEPVAFD